MLCRPTKDANEYYLDQYMRRLEESEKAWSAAYSEMESLMETHKGKIEKYDKLLEVMGDDDQMPDGYWEWFDEFSSDVSAIAGEYCVDADELIKDFAEEHQAISEGVDIVGINQRMLTFCGIFK